MVEPQSDRLIGPSALPQPVSNVEVMASDDILDEKNNRDAHRVDTMISESAKVHREQIMQRMQEAPAPAPARDFWFLYQPAQGASVPGNMVTFNTQVVTPSSAQPASAAQPQTQQTAADPFADEAHIVAELDARRQSLPTTSYYGHLHTIQPLSAQGTPMQQPSVQQGAVQQPTAVTSAPQALPLVSPSPGPQAPLVSAPQEPPAVTPQGQAAILQLSPNNDLNVATIAREAERAAPQDEVVIKLH